MTIHRITNTVTNTVYLDSRTYAETLVVAATGLVAPLAAGADGIVGHQSGDEITNRGSIVAAAGAVDGNGGIGIKLTPGGTIINRGFVSGGATVYGSKPVYGGSGIEVGSGTITNSGTIVGGAVARTDGQGGAGVLAPTGGVTIINSGSISGGHGYGVGKGYGADSSGVGVDLAGAGMLSNTGTIDGGFTQYGNGSAVELAQHSTLDNHGKLYGGNGVGHAAVVSTNSTIANYGTILGREGAYYSGGVVGVSITGGSLDNAALIEGGTGGTTDHYGNISAGDGIDATAAKITNGGTILGGDADNAFPGAIGIKLAAAASLSNTGTISGGKGGTYYAVSASAGGIGVLLGSTTSATNSGLIEGGAGGQRDLYAGGAGGVGVSLTTDSAFANAGTIIGGAGGRGSQFGGSGSGGDAADINGGTLTTSGTIIGGAGGMSHKFGSSPAGDAVNFGTLAGTLIIDPGAVFDGAIAGDGSVDDTLVLGGKAAGTLSGFGSTITGITTISENTRADWTLQGTITGPGDVDIGMHAQLDLTGGPVSIATIAFAAGGYGTVMLGSPASVTSTFSGFGTGDRIDLNAVQGTSLSYADGTLTVLGANNSVLATLDFAGDYTLGDFKLHADGGNTDVVYAGGVSGSAPTSSGARPDDAHVAAQGPIQPGRIGWLDTGIGQAHLWLLDR